LKGDSIRLLALTDIHADEEAIGKVRARIAAGKYDAVLLLGDITDRGPVSFAEDFLDMLEEAGTKVFALFGNMDPEGVAGLLEERGVGLHGRKVKLERGFSLAGFGGSPPTPFGTPTEFSEEEIAAGLKGLKIDPETILATHFPPFGIGGLDSARGMPVGSKALRKVIEEKKPALNLCGHIHEHEGEARIGATRVVKVGPAMSGRAAELEVGKVIAARFISL